MIKNRAGRWPEKFAGRLGDMEAFILANKFNENSPTNLAIEQEQEYSRFMVAENSNCNPSARMTFKREEEVLGPQDLPNEWETKR